MHTKTPAAPSPAAASTDPAVVHAEIRAASSMTGATDRLEQALNAGVPIADLLAMQAASFGIGR